MSTLNYLLEANLGLCLFLVVYRTLLQKENDFGWKRVFLLMGVFTSVVFPLFHFNTSGHVIPSLEDVLPTRWLPEITIQGDNTSYYDALTKPNRRLVVVPIVDNQDFLNMKGRSQPIMIRGFARFYLIGAEGGEITGRFIDTKFGNNAPPPQELRVKLVR